MLAHDISSAVPRTSDVFLEDDGAPPAESSSAIRVTSTFSGLHLPESLLSGLKRAGFVRPSPVQAKAIPAANLGLDMVIQSKSGTGKTLVFMISALKNLESSEESSGTRALILAPTREIAAQGARVGSEIASGMPHVKIATFIGGMSLEEDLIKCRRCNLAIGTPGRVKQLIEEKHLKTDSVRLFALDEADKLMDRSFINDVTWIFNQLPSSKQVMALSATFPEELAALIERYMKNPVQVRLGKDNQVLQGVSQYVQVLRSHPVPAKQVKIKSRHLFDLLNAISFSQCLVFCNYAFRAEEFCKEAENRGWPAVFIAATQDQRSRLRSIHKLKQFQIRVLFTTDLTARGIDAENVNLVVNLDVPWKSDTYLHRIGRSGRFGTLAIAITLVSEGKELEQLRKIVFKTSSVIKQLPSDIPDDLDVWCPDQVRDLEPLQPLEYSSAEEDGLPSSPKGKKVKKRGRKKKTAEEDDNDVVDITKGWMEVPKDESVLDKPIGFDVFNGVFSEESANPNEKKKPRARPIAQQDLELASVKRDGVEQSRKVLRAFFQATAAKGQSETKKLSPGDLRARARDFLDQDFVACNGDGDSKESPTHATISEDVKKAAAIVLEDVDKTFQNRLNRACQKMEGLSLQEALNAMNGGREDESSKQDLEADDVKVKRSQKAGASDEKGDDEVIVRQSLKRPMQPKTIPSLLSSSSNEILFDLPLPNPHPNSLVPGQVGRILDGSWLDEWFRQVEENKQFVRDMELVRMMSGQ